MPENDVCGLIRFKRIMPSESKAFWSKWIGRPNEFLPRTTVCISQRMGQPTLAWVTPSSAKSSRWPFSVPPPCDPMAATTNGWKPRLRTVSATALVI